MIALAFAATGVVLALATFAAGLRIGGRRERDARVEAVDAAFTRGKRTAADALARDGLTAYARGLQAGADALANEWLVAEAQAGDPFDAWPGDSVRVEGRPS